MSHPVPWQEEPYLPEDASEEEWQQTTQKEENEQQP